MDYASPGLFVNMCGGEVTRVPITPAMKAAVTKAHSAYLNRIEEEKAVASLKEKERQQKQEQKEKDAKLMRENKERKRKINEKEKAFKTN